MAEATASTASSIEMSSLASTLGRRDNALGSAANGYDEERAEPSSRACVGGKDPTHQPILRRLVTYLRLRLKSRSVTIHLPPQEQSERAEKRVERIDDHPDGYPQLAAFLACDLRKFLMCRTFMYSRIRQLLYCQDELAQLQNNLLKQDEEDASTSHGRKLLISRERYEYRNEQFPQKALINEIGPKLKAYDDLMERTIRVASLRAPDARDLDSIKHWMDHYQPLCWEERENLLKGPDFVALVEKQEECWLDNIVERALSKYSPKDSIFTSPEIRGLSDHPSLRLRSKERIDVLIRIVLTATAVSMLLGPSAVLYLVGGHKFLKLLLIGAFTVLFSAALHTFSKARRHENFAATSA